MNTGTALIVVGGLGLAAFIYFRSQQQQQAAVIAAAASAPAAAGGGGGGGGGIGGLASRAINQWRQDPLGIANTKAAAGAVVGVVKSGVSEVVHLPSDIIGGIRSLF